MRIIRDYQYVASCDRGASVAIGNFDGVHLGHQSVITIARQTRPNVPLGILTFEPHPREYFDPAGKPFRLTSSVARASRLAKLGVERLYELNFNKSLASLSPEEFASKVVHEGLGLSHVVVGSDFVFGKDRAGNADDLVGLGKKIGFDVTIASLLTKTGATVSSTAIRTALSEGRPQDAAKMLGHWHRIEGRVIGGEQRGRTLGFPTANLSIAGLHPPAFGVYAVVIDIIDGQHRQSYLGAASLGLRPMFGGTNPNLETFLFDFSGDLYGATLSVGLIEFLRPEKSFDSVNDLIAQMHRDCQQAQEILGAL
ncbi:MAG: bifunctional riboflavin kinase/FAD synthetase [Aestuariivita sp.]|nr:bifunctional riboflavin kinase/FAD synthetase [Aestuariivita sp.]MCY4203268.1 bifunctional riboflavin kinase/FAD synthetase [Aestuariivita sp.]